MVRPLQIEHWAHNSNVKALRPREDLSSSLYSFDHGKTFRLSIEYLSFADHQLRLDLDLVFHILKKAIFHLDEIYDMLCRDIFAKPNA